MFPWIFRAVCVILLNRVKTDITKDIFVLDKEYKYEA